VSALAASALPHPLWHPLQHLRGRVQRFWLSRLRRQDSILLNQRNVYILPTRPGWMLALTLLILLIASINYQLNLGYLLTFLLTGSALVGMHVCHANLRDIQLHLGPLEPVYAGSSARLQIRMDNTRGSPRYAIALAVLGSEQWNWSDLPAQGSASVALAFTPQQRGRCALPTLTAETRFPLGSFRVWTVWRPASELLVYPAPELRAPPLPGGRPGTTGTRLMQHQRTGEFDGARAYRHGDPLKMVLWKKVAKNSTLISRDTEQTMAVTLWLDLAECGNFAGGSASLEHKLSRLCAWVLLADRLQIEYGLRLPSQTIAPASGAAHKNACLQALALY
jgi:uncharacterized protein (DUF58 family)